MKWGFLPKNDKPRYLCVNADEGEPGTFKDRLILEKDPHRLIESCVVSAYAINCKTAYIYIRGEFTEGIRVLTKALEEAYAAGYLGKNILGTGVDVDLYLHSGAGSYECGEETALIESLEGKRGQPRLKPPFPAVSGLYNCPTVVNNVETLVCVPLILEKGAEWFAAAGDIYHRSCSSESKWSPSTTADGKCLGCGAAIPDDVLASARGRIPPPGSDEDSDSSA